MVNWVMGKEQKYAWKRDIVFSLHNDSDHLELVKMAVSPFYSLSCNFQLNWHHYYPCAMENNVSFYYCHFTCKYGIQFSTMWQLNSVF